MEVYSVQNVSQYTSDINRNTKRELGKEDFLNLLVTQLKYQDPLNPVEDKEFIAQMAQFSALEQMYNLNSGISSIKAFSLIGTQVTAEIIDDTTGKLNVITGEVESVTISGSEISVVVNGRDIPIDKITNVEHSDKVSFEEYLLNRILEKLDELASSNTEEKLSSEEESLSES